MARLESSKKLKELMLTYYLEAKNASFNGKKIVYLTSGAPVEPVYALDMIPVYPENYAAMCGASHQSATLLNESASLGFAQDLCSYSRTDFGVHKINGGPLMGLPRPDAIVAAGNICRTVFKWFGYLAGYYKCPYFRFNMPFLHKGMIKYAIRLTAAQMTQYIEFLESIAGKKMDWERFIETVRLSIEASNLWRRILDTAKYSPSPINAFDTFIHLAPIVTLRGTRRCVEYYKTLLKELNDLIKEGNNVHEIRLGWDNLPVWFAMRKLGEMFFEKGSSIVIATYTRSWTTMERDVDPNNKRDVFEALSEAYLKPYINRNLQDRISILLDMVKEFRLDGMVFHSNKSCKPYSIGQYFIKERLEKQYNVPGLILELDMNDPSVFSSQGIKTRVEAFLETIRGVT